MTDKISKSTTVNYIGRIHSERKTADPTNKHTFYEHNFAARLKSSLNNKKISVQASTKANAASLATKTF